MPLASWEAGVDLRPHNLAVTSQGNIALWVRGRGSDQILTVDTSGAILASWGRLGEGPGEIRAADLLLSGDSTITIAGLSGEPVRVYRPTGELLVQQSRPPVGLPSDPAHGRIVWWTAKHLGQGARDAARRVVREGPLVNWCLFSECSQEILASTDPVIETINASAPPMEVGLWPGVATRGDIVVVGDGYRYRLWQISIREPRTLVEFGLDLPPRMATDSQVALAESRWARLEQGIPGPDGKRVRMNFDREREFLQTTPYPHFIFHGLGFDGQGRLWVMGRDHAASLFVDIFADTTYLGRRTIACNPSGYSAAVRGRWFAVICNAGDQAEERFVLRLFKIIEAHRALDD